jgi:hypothetical protein
MSFTSRLLFLSDKLQQLKDSARSESLTDDERHHIESQILITERALKQVFEEEQRRRGSTSSQ